MLNFVQKPQNTVKFTLFLENNCWKTLRPTNSMYKNYLINDNSVHYWFIDNDMHTNLETLPYIYIFYYDQCPVIMAGQSKTDLDRNSLLPIQGTLLIKYYVIKSIF